LLRRRLPSIGKSQNLLGWRSYDFLNKIDDVKKRRFVALLRDLLYGSGSSGERIERFNAGLKELLDGTGIRIIPAWTRALSTFFLMIAFPSVEIFVRTTPFNTSAQMVMVTCSRDFGPLIT
jgi:hypothetical protein